ncbi:MAG TPA: ABC transporter permease [Pirellulaceae bacterium]|nr:ABC transporter permease [Pirellulaceae bacterium]
MSDSTARAWRPSLPFNELALLVAILVVVLITAAVDSNHSYLRDPYTSVRDIARNVALLGIFALGAAVVIIAGGIDLSSGSMIAFSSTICASTMMLLAPQTMMNMQPVGPLVAAAGIIAAICSGFLVGSLHAWLITSVRLPPFVATLATLVGLRSFARAYCGYITAKTLGGSGNTEINVYDPYFKFMRDEVWIVFVPTFLVLAVFTFILLNHTVLGRHIYALGGNEQAARLSGIRTESVKWFAYCFSAITASIAGVFYMADQSVASPVNQGVGYELNAIAAAVVGGCSLQGGIGTVPGVIFGVIFLRVVIDSVAKLIKSGSDIYEGMIVGIVVVIAVTFSQLRQIRASGGELFPGKLGWFAIPTLSAMIGLLTAMATANMPYLKGRDIWIGAAAGIAALVALGAVKLLEFQRQRRSEA